MKQGIFLLNHFFLEKHIDLGSELPLFTTGTRPLLLTVPHTRVCTYANVCMCTYILTHKHTHTHAHTHTHTHSQLYTHTKTPMRATHADHQFKQKKRKVGTGETNTGKTRGKGKHMCARERGEKKCVRMRVRACACVCARAHARARACVCARARARVCVRVPSRGGRGIDPGNIRSPTRNRLRRAASSTIVRCASAGRSAPLWDVSAVSGVYVGRGGALCG